MKHAFARIVQALFYLASLARALSYDTEQVRWNLNQNQSAGRPQDYWGEWDDHTFFPSPKNWRFPFYLLTQDRFADGDPSNNEANGTGQHLLRVKFCPQFADTNLCYSI